MTSDLFLELKQVFSTETGVDVIDVPAPLLQKGNILVEVKYSFISSGTESASINADSNFKKNSERLKKLVSHLQSHGIKKTISVVQERILSNGTNDGPLVPLGYSCSGQVVSVGEGVTLFKLGDLIACAGVNKATHSELVVVPENLVIPIPEGCSIKDASSVAVGAIAMQAVRRSEVGLGESVAVIGLGLVGLLSAKMLQCAGATVLGYDIDENRTDKAKTLGLEKVCWKTSEFQRSVNNFTSNMGADVCLVAAGSKDNSILQTATEITRKKGRVVIVGLVPMQFDINPFLRKELDLLASIS